MKLDPGLIAGHLSKDDADFVDVIHADAFLYGAPISTGTVDFWPNGWHFIRKFISCKNYKNYHLGGKSLQPGCPRRNYQFLTPNDLCSHWRSWRFWAESVSSSSLRTFQARKCESWERFMRGLCDHYEVVNMGQDCPLK